MGQCAYLFHLLHFQQLLLEGELCFFQVFHVLFVMELCCFDLAVHLFNYLLVLEQSVFGIVHFSLVGVGDGPQSVALCPQILDIRLLLLYFFLEHRLIFLRNLECFPIIPRNRLSSLQGNGQLLGLQQHLRTKEAHAEDEAVDFSLECPHFIRNVFHVCAFEGRKQGLQISDQSVNFSRLCRNILVYELGIHYIQLLQFNSRQLIKRGIFIPTATFIPILTS